MLFPDHDGSMQTTIKMAAARIGIDVNLTPLPFKRCRDSVDANLVAGILGAGYTPQNESIAVFPMKANGVDTSRALVSLKAMVFRAKGSGAGWNGREFSGLNLPVLFQGYPAFLSKLEALRVPYDYGTTTVENNFSKLLADRGAVVIAFENDGMAALAKEEFAQKIEMLPTPFTEMAFYLAFSKQYFKQNTALAEKLWNAIHDARNSPEMKANIGAGHR